jgi:hypothetical protein
VDFCDCSTGPDNEDPPLERQVQLLRACGWPTTIAVPNTYATFTLLRLFQTLSCLGKVTAYDFLRGVEMITNRDGLDKPPMHKCFLKCTVLFIYFFSPRMRIFGFTIEGSLEKRQTRFLGTAWATFASGTERTGIMPTSRSMLTSNCQTAPVSRQCSRPTQSASRDHGRRVWRASPAGDIICGTRMVCKLAGGTVFIFIWMKVASDLGYRQCNMDFILLSTLIAFQLLWLVVSYDIACQYAIYF